MVGADVNAIVAVAGALALGAAIGGVTGVIVAKGKVQAFIATLVMMLLLRGVTRVYTDGSPISTGFSDNADVFSWFGIGRLFGIPAPVWLMIVVFAAAGICCITPVWAVISMRWAVMNPQPACPVLMSIKLKSLFTLSVVCWRH